jgi:transcriptional regulator with XRE-family HTH domain
MAKKGISGKKLAQKMEVTETTISRWRERGCFSIETLGKIAGHCDMTFDELMTLAD